MVDQSGEQMQFKVVQDLMHELQGMWQGLRDLEASEEKNRATIKTLSANEERHLSIINNLPQRVFLKDTGLTYLFCNNAFAGDLNLTPDAIVGKSDQDLFPEEVSARQRLVESTVLSTGNQEEFEEKYNICGRDAIFHGIKIPVRDKDDNIKGLVGVLWDVTEDRQKDAKQRDHFQHVEELLSKRATEIESLRCDLEKTFSERKNIEKEFESIRQNLETELAQRNADIERLNSGLGRALAEHKQKEEEALGIRQRLEAELAQRNADIEKLRKDIEKISSEKQDAVERLKKSVGQFQELMQNMQKVAGVLGNEA